MSQVLHTVPLSLQHILIFIDFMILKFQFISESLYIRLQRQQQKRLDEILFHEKRQKNILMKVMFTTTYCSHRFTKPSEAKMYLLYSA